MKATRATVIKLVTGMSLRTKAESLSCRVSHVVSILRIKEGILTNNKYDKKFYYLNSKIIINFHF